MMRERERERERDETHSYYEFFFLRKITTMS